MKFCVCGGGNGAHAFAAILGSNGVEVTVYTPLQDEVEKWNSGGLIMTARFKDGSPSKTGHPLCVTADAKEAVHDADVTLICLPTFLHEPTLKAVGPFLKENSFIGTIEGCWWGKPPIPGTEAWMSKVNFYALQTLPWAARLEVYGKSVEILGKKDVINIACSPAQKVQQLADMLTPVIEVTMRPTPNLISLLALDPGNIIHPGIMYGKLHSWNGEPFQEAPLFYQGVNEEIASIMQTMDAEVLAIRDEMKRRYASLDLSGIQPTLMWLHEAYSNQIKDKSSFASSFATNSAYAGLKFPMKQTEQGLIPLFDYRYLTADVPYGIVVIRGIGELLGVNTPMLDKVISWAQEKLGKEYLINGRINGKDLAETRAPQKFGIVDLDKFMESVLL